MEVVTKIAPIALALIMLGLGMGLTVRDFLRVINNPKDFLISKKLVANKLKISSDVLGDQSVDLKDLLK